jgi:hypothetical protein
LKRRASYKLGTAKTYDVLLEDTPQKSCHAQWNMGHRGVLPHDTKKEISQRKAKEIGAGLLCEGPTRVLSSWPRLFFGQQ